MFAIALWCSPAGNTHRYQFLWWCYGGSTNFCTAKVLIFMHSGMVAEIIRLISGLELLPVRDYGIWLSCVRVQRAEYSQMYPNLIRGVKQT